MDTRRVPGAGRDDSAERELGTDTVPVELVELPAVGNAGGGQRRRLLVLGIVGVVAFGAIILGTRPAVPTPSPSLPIALDPSILVPSVVAAGPTVRPSGTPRPTIRPSQEPTPPPLWQWTRTGFDLERPISLEGAVGLNGRVLVLARRLLDPGEAWGVFSITADEYLFLPAPAAIEDLWGGAVIDDRLWFLARVSGVSAQEGTSRLASTADGEGWEALDAVVGLGANPYASFLKRVGGNWVAAVNQVGDGGTGAPTQADMMWSSDGVHWDDSNAPGGSGIVSYSGAVMLGDTLVVLGSDWRNHDDRDDYILTSGDGQAWHKFPLELAPRRRPHGLVCGHGVCLLSVETSDDGGTTTSSLLISPDAEHWTEVSGAPALEPDTELSDMTTTSTGFIASSGAGTVWLSEDGRSWRSLEVLGYTLLDPKDFYGLAVAGDLIVGLDQGNGEVSDGYWQGSLAAMAAGLR